MLYRAISRYLSSFSKEELEEQLKTFEKNLKGHDKTMKEAIEHRLAFLRELDNI